MSEQVFMLVQAAATLAGMFSLICRGGRMTPATPMWVRLQHLVLFAGLVFSLVLPAQPGKAVLALAVMLWLALGAWRWRFGDPTHQPHPPPVPVPVQPERASDW